MRKILLLVMLTICVFLSGCAIESDRIYTVCKIDNGTVYVYDGSGKFYTVLQDGTLQPNINPNLITKPALMLLPKEGDFEFEYVLPGLYKGTLTSVNHYVHKVCTDLSAIDTVYADPNNLEIFVPAGDISIRILFNIRGDVRIYSSDNTIPVYLNKKDNY